VLREWIALAKSPLPVPEKALHLLVFAYDIQEGMSSGQLLSEFFQDAQVPEGLHPADDPSLFVPQEGR